MHRGLVSGLMRSDSIGVSDALFCKGRLDTDSMTGLVWRQK